MFQLLKHLENSLNRVACLLTSPQENLKGCQCCIVGREGTSGITCLTQQGKVELYLSNTVTQEALLLLHPIYLVGSCGVCR